LALEHEQRDLLRRIRNSRLCEMRYEPSACRGTVARDDAGDGRRAAGDLQEQRVPEAASEDDKRARGKQQNRGDYDIANVTRSHAAKLTQSSGAAPALGRRNDSAAEGGRRSTREEL